MGVQEAVKVAHAAGISVEAQLGHIQYTKEHRGVDYNGLTDPEEAKKFIDDTGIDCLAVSIGTAHGAYEYEPDIDFNRLKSIKEATSFPLVIHGGSGTGSENLRKACANGINKVNISNALLNSVSKAVTSRDMSKGAAYSIWAMIQMGFRDKLKEYIDILGSKGKTWIYNERGNVTENISERYKE